MGWDGIYLSSVLPQALTLARHFIWISEQFLQSSVREKGSHLICRTDYLLYSPLTPLYPEGVVTFVPLGRPLTWGCVYVTRPTGLKSFISVGWLLLPTRFLGHLHEATTLWGGRQRGPGSRSARLRVCSRPQVSATEDGTITKDTNVVLEIPASTTIAYSVLELYVKLDGQFGECSLQLEAFGRQCSQG